MPFNSHDDTERLKELLIAQVEGRLDELGRAMLNELLAENPNARRFYLSYMQMHAMLLWRHGASNQVEPQSESTSLLLEALVMETDASCRRAQEKSKAQQLAQREQAERNERIKRLAGSSDEPAAPVKRIVIPKAMFYGAIATVAAILIVLILPMFESKPVAVTSIVEDQPVTPQFVQVATLVEQFDAHWIGASGSHRPASGDAILNQPMHLVSGLAKLRFNNEAEVILEAPCTIEPISESEIKLTHGKLVGRCGTAASKGFMVQTPDARVVDLGTEFGVSADSNQTDVHVFQGEVSLASQADHDADLYAGKIITANMAYRVDPQGRMSVIDAAQVDYLRQVPQSAYELAVRRSRPLTWWRFDQATDRAVVRDHGRLGADGAVLRGVRFNQHDAISHQRNSAAYLDGRTGYVHISEDKNLSLTSTFTIEAWIYVSSSIDHPIMRILSNRGRQGDIETGFGFGILGSSGHDPRYLEVGASANVLQFTFFGVRDVFSDKPAPIDRWTHVAAIVRDDSHVEFFIDGRSTNVQTWSPDQTQQYLRASPGPLCLGRNPRETNDWWQGEYWGGGLDEVAIYDRMLSADEILQHYLAGAESASSRQGEVGKRPKHIGETVDR